MPIAGKAQYFSPFLLGTHPNKKLVDHFVFTEHHFSLEDNSKKLDLDVSWFGFFYLGLVLQVAKEFSKWV